MAKRKSGGSPFWLAVLALGVLGLAVSWAWTTFGGRDPGTRRSGHHVVRVQVLNGSGEPGVGTRVAAFLREGGFQVTDVRNADRNDYFATFVVARRGDLSLAEEVAHYLGDHHSCVRSGARSWRMSRSWSAATAASSRSTPESGGANAEEIR